MDVSNAAGAAYASFVIVVLSSISSISRLAKTPYRVKTTNESAIYEDQDGKATEESMALYTAKTHFIVIFSAAIFGLIESLALAVFATVRKEHSYTDLSLTEAWLLFPAWVCDPVSNETSTIFDRP